MEPIDSNKVFSDHSAIDHAMQDKLRIILREYVDETGYSDHSLGVKIFKETKGLFGKNTLWRFYKNVTQKSGKNYYLQDPDNKKWLCQFLEIVKGVSIENIDHYVSIEAAKGLLRMFGETKSPDAPLVAAEGLYRPQSNCENESGYAIKLTNLISRDFFIVEKLVLNRNPRRSRIGKNKPAIRVNSRGWAVSDNQEKLWIFLKQIEDESASCALSVGYVCDNENVLNGFTVLSMNFSPLTLNTVDQDVRKVSETLSHGAQKYIRIEENVLLKYLEYGKDIKVESDNVIQGNFTKKNNKTRQFRGRFRFRRSRTDQSDNREGNFAMEGELRSKLGCELIEAIRNGEDLDVIQGLIDRGAPVNFIHPETRTTPLHMVAFYTDRDVYRMLARVEKFNYLVQDAGKRYPSELAGVYGQDWPLCYHLLKKERQQRSAMGLKAETTPLPEPEPPI